MSRKILTNISERRAIHDWHNKTEFRKEIVGGAGFISDLSAVLRLFCIQKYYDLIILNSNRVGNLYTFMAGLLSIKLTPVLMIDCLWYEPKNQFSYTLKKIQFHFMAKAVIKFVVWASHEVGDYSRTFKIPQGKFTYIPHHHTLEGFHFEVSNGNYIFSGGDGDRDYPTLIKAVTGLKVDVIIATRNNNFITETAIPGNIEISPRSPEDFRRLMAGAKIVIIPMAKGLLHSGGQQSYLNAMAMGKPVIVADDRGAFDYIKNNINGIVIPAGNPTRMREAIVKILTETEFSLALAKNALLCADTYSTKNCMNNILKIAETLLSDR